MALSWQARLHITQKEEFSRKPVHVDKNNQCFSQPASVAAAASVAVEGTYPLLPHLFSSVNQGLWQAVCKVSLQLSEILMRYQNFQQ